MTVQRVQRRVSRQASRRHRPVPGALKPFIDMANVLPRPEKLPGKAQTLRPEDPPPEQFGILEGWGFGSFYIERFIDEYPRFREFLAGVDLRDKADYMSEARRRCRLLMGVRNWLYRIARSHATKEKVHIPLVYGIDEPVSLLKDESGNFRVDLHPLVRALDGVEAHRIRECPICGEIFWAGRIDQPCCSRRCAKVQRTRRWRDAYPETYKERRVNRADEKDREGSK